MKVKVLILGPFDTNCYILEKDHKVLIIDPADEKDKIIKLVGNDKVVGIIVTHYHPDHVGALEAIKKHYNVPVYDIKNLKLTNNNIDGFTFDVIHTPGHKNDQITIYFKKESSMFCGDFIFYGSIGRWDLPEGDFSKMKKSIKNILTYPLDTKIYPGHGPMTVLGNEAFTLNYFMNSDFY